MPSYKFNRYLDELTKRGVQPLFDMDGRPIVMSGLFKKRLEAQMKYRQALEKSQGPRMYASAVNGLDSEEEMARKAVEAIRRLQGMGVGGAPEPLPQASPELWPGESYDLGGWGLAQGRRRGGGGMA